MKNIVPDFTTDKGLTDVKITPRSSRHKVSTIKERAEPAADILTANYLEPLKAGDIFGYRNDRYQVLSWEAGKLTASKCICD